VASEHVHMSDEDAQHKSGIKSIARYVTVPTVGRLNAGRPVDQDEDLANIHLDAVTQAISEEGDNASVVEFFENNVGPFEMWWLVSAIRATWSYLKGPASSPAKSTSSAAELTLVSPNDTIRQMRRKHRRTLEAIFADPVRANVNWTDIEAMLKACGAELTEGKGSRVRIALNGVRAVFHRPHPQKETDKGALRSVRRFLTEAGITP
jgi:hypothetical protein